MDSKDYKILYALDKNSRATFSQIAKETKIPQETIRYRINQYGKTKLVKNWLTVIDSAKIGMSYYEVYLKLQNINEEKKNQVVAFLVKNSNINWVGELEGIYDIGFITVVKNQLELQSIIDDLMKRFGSMIMKKTIAIYLMGEFLGRDYLIGQKRNLELSIKYVRNSTEITILDPVDQRICKLLSGDSRIPAVNIARELGKSADTVALRIRELQKKRIITGFGIVPDNEQLGQNHYKILIYLSNSSDERTRKLLGAIKMNNRVISVLKVLAEWDYAVDIEVKNTTELKEFTMGITDTFSDIIRDYSVMRIIAMPKYNFFP